MRIERFDALLRGRLNHNAPAALERLLQQRRQDLFRRLPFEVIEEDFSQCGGVAGHLRGVVAVMLDIRKL